MSGDKECHFAISFHAPDGLVGIDKTIGSCSFRLYAYTSGYNGKVVLTAPSNDVFEWYMDSSDYDEMFASGNFFAGIDDAKKHLRSLSKCLTAADIPHSIGLDDPNGELCATFEYQWPPTMPVPVT